MFLCWLTALTGSDKESADTSGDVSEPSEHEVELPEIDSPRSSDRESMDIERSSIPSRTQRSSVRVEPEQEEKDDAGPPPPRHPLGATCHLISVARPMALWI